MPSRRSTTLVQSLAALALLLPCASVIAEAQGASRAPGWKVTFDRSGVPDSALSMGPMAPGWHVTSRAGAPAAVAFDPSLTGARTFRLESEQIFFSAGAGAGLVIAGRGLETGAPRFVAFTVFPDGRFSVIRMAGAQREVLVMPTVDAGIAKHPGGTVQVKNLLQLEGDEKTVVFKVNGSVVSRLPRAVVDPGGTVGLRFEPGVNIHITSFVLDGRNVAPVPAR